MALRSAVIAAALLALAGTSNAETELRIAVYAPWSGPSTADQRHALAITIESAVASGGNATAKVSSYARLADFRREISRGNVDIAVVDTAAMSSLGKNMKVRATWTSGDSWVLVGAEKYDSLANRRLALQGGASAASKRFVAKLLRGQADSKFWKSIVGAPVTADARELVVRGKADVAVLPASQVAGTESIKTVGSFGEIVVATPANKDLAAARARVQAAVQSELEGNWSSGRPSLPGPVAPAKLSAAKPTGPAPPLSGLFGLLEPEMPEVAAKDLWIAPDAP